MHGLSLGAYGSEQSARLHEMIEDPVQGALWSGPPFSSPIWSAVTRARNPGTPEWLPTYGDGSIVRFTNQQNHLDIPGADDQTPGEALASGEPTRSKAATKSHEPITVARYEC